MTMQKIYYRRIEEERQPWKFPLIKIDANV